MKNIDINIGNICNNKCKFCMVEHDARNFVDFNKIKGDIIQAKKQGFESIGFLGGEFTLHPDIIAILKLCKLLKFKIVHIISNGRRFQDKFFLIKLIEAGANRFSVSIHSHRAEVEDKLTQAKGGFDEKIQGLRNLISLYKDGKIKYHVSINLVINKGNYLEIPKTLEYFNHLGIKDFRLNFMWIRGRAKESKELYLKYQELMPVVDKIIDSARLNYYNIDFDGIPPCLFNQNNLKYIGELKDFSTDVVAYNNPQRLRQSFNWQSLKKNILKTKNVKCKKCIYTDNCDGVWKDYIKIFGWSDFFNS
ncbi:MAG: radical SAM protein [Candidatus Parcubacteria bacterium]|nr:radical SAM protein [Candidatus Parcubacteria bacterium]